MVNKNKQKGTRWERDAVELLNKAYPGTWKRMPTSGAMGTALDIPILKGDLSGKYSFIPKRFVAEAKVGYGGSQMTVFKEWFDKIAEEAKQSYAWPLVLLKFEKARTGVKHVLAMDLETWEALLEYIDDQVMRLDDAYDELAELRKR